MRGTTRKVLLVLCVAAVVVAGGMTGAASGSTPAKKKAKIDPNATITFSQTGPFTHLDPARRGTAGDDGILLSLYDRLVYLDNKVQPQPMLATKWSFSPDGKQLTFTLRKDDLFHDGSTIDATAVKKNMDRYKTLATSTAKAAYTMVDSVDVVDASTVRFNCNRPCADLLPTLGIQTGSIANPKVFEAGVDFDGTPNNAVGSGPYMITSFKPNDTAVFERAPGKYWDHKAGKLKMVTVKYLADYTVAFNAISSGQFDAGRTGEELIAQAENLSGHKFVKYQQLSNLVFMMRANRPPFDNPDVRHAMSMLIDREAIGTQLTSGGCPALDQYFGPLSPAHVDNYKQPYSYNVTKAKELLAKAGVPNLTFSAVSGTTNPMKDIQLALQGMFAKGGVTMNLTTEESLTSVFSFRDGKYDAYVQTNTGLPNPYSMMVTYMYTPGAPWNLSNGEGTDMKDIAAKALDPNLSAKDTKAVWSQVADKMAEYMWAVPVCNRTSLWIWPSNMYKTYKTMSYAWASVFDIRYLARTKAK